MTTDTPSNKCLSLSLVLVNAPGLPQQEELLSELSSLGETAVTKMSATNGNAITFHMGPHAAAVAWAASPVPWSRLEGPCETAWWWPEAEAKLQAHRSHLLIALQGENSSEVARAIALTRLTAAVAAHVDAAGVFWGGGSLVHDPSVFIAEARKTSAEKLPLHLWIDFRTQRSEDGAYRLFTTGLKALGKMEIEIPNCRHAPAELLDFAYSMADYLLVRGAVVRDGHTVGRSESEKVTAALAPSMLDSRMTVLRLDF